MKSFRTILITCLIILSTGHISAQLSYDQWETVELEDEFGDKTGEKVKRIFHKGKFSNSAVYNEDLIVKVVDYGTNILISLYEYGEPPVAELVYEGSFGSISIKMPDDTVKKYEVFAPESGGLYLNDEDDLYQLLKNGKNQKLKVSVRQSSFSDIGQSSYNFNLLTQ
jgi:hypothetical protein